MQSQNPYQPQPQEQQPYGQMPLSQPAKKRRRWPRILAGVVVVFVLAIAGLVLVVNNSPAKAASQHYYDAIKSQDYATAYSYLDPTLTLTIQGQSQKIDTQSFTQVAQDYDSQKGKVSNYSITSVSLNSSTDTGNTADITVSVTRNTTYDVHLQLKQEGDDWKVVSFDSL